MRIEIVLPPWLAGHLLSASIARASTIGLEAAGHQVVGVKLPTWGCDAIMLWGLGHPMGQSLLAHARRRAVTVIGWDLGYWKRTGPHARYRVAINDHHPRSYVMAKPRPLSRLLADGICLREDGNPDGPVYLIGMGRKSAETYGEEPGVWEEAALAKIQRAWPERKVIFRPRRGGGALHHGRGIEVAPLVPIEQLLQRAAAVYCRHSNVAVDAIIAGVPAIAEDGAAAAVCETAPADGRLPEKLPRETRTAFLGNLAWFQWGEAEMRHPETWAVIEDIIRSVK